MITHFVFNNVVIIALIPRPVSCESFSNCCHVAEIARMLSLLMEYITKSLGIVLSETGEGLAELKVVMEKRKARDKTDTQQGDQRTKSQEL